MIIPTVTIDIWKKTGSDLYGQPSVVKYGSERIAPVKLDFRVGSTSVRTDTAASKARAKEDEAVVVILAAPNTAIELDDKLTILGNTVVVAGVHPRYTVTGVLDHYQVDCTAWT